MLNKYPAIWFIFFLQLSACHSLRKSAGSDGADKKDNTKNYEYYSQKLGFIVDSRCNKKLMEESVSWLGVPYKYGGNGKSGIDCSGLVHQIYNRVYSKQLPRTAIEMFEQSDKIAESKLKEGDLVFFNFEGKKASHVGIYLKEERFIHASTKKGVIIGDLNDAYNKRFFLRGGRVN